MLPSVQNKVASFVVMSSFPVVASFLCTSGCLGYNTQTPLPVVLVSGCDAACMCGVNIVVEYFDS